MAYIVPVVDNETSEVYCYVINNDETLEYNKFIEMIEECVRNVKQAFPYDYDTEDLFRALSNLCETNDNITYMSTDFGCTDVLF